MSTIDMTKVKNAVSNVGALIDLFGDIKKQISSIELKELWPFGRRRASPLAAGAWFSAGVVTGATAASIFSPKSGAELRQEIARTAEKLIDPIARKWRARRDVAETDDGIHGVSGVEGVHAIHS